MMRPIAAVLNWSSDFDILVANSLLARKGCECTQLPSGTEGSDDVILATNQRELKWEPQVAVGLLLKDNLPKAYLPRELHRRLPFLFKQGLGHSRMYRRSSIRPRSSLRPLLTSAWPSLFAILRTRSRLCCFAVPLTLFSAVIVYF